MCSNFIKRGYYTTLKKMIVKYFFVFNIVAIHIYLRCFDKSLFKFHVFTSKVCITVVARVFQSPFFHDRSPEQTNKRKNAIHGETEAKFIKRNHIRSTWLLIVSRALLARRGPVDARLNDREIERATVRLTVSICVE